jgi:hypothetical protein
VAAKIVMVVEDQDAGIGTRRRTIEMGRSEPLMPPLTTIRL